MNKITKTIFKLLLSTRTTVWLLFIFVLLLLAPSNGISMSENQIFEWVAKELKIKEQYKMPIIQYVSKTKLQEVFLETSKPSYNRWTREYGKKKAAELMDLYSNEVIGFFIPKTGDLYIGEFLESCKKESIVAHELVHFFQHMKDGPIDPKSGNVANKNLFREMQAGNIEKKYMEKFCGKDKM